MSKQRCFRRFASCRKSNIGYSALLQHPAYRQGSFSFHGQNKTVAASATAERNTLPDLNPAGVEALMRLQSGTLNHLPRETFVVEAKLAAALPPSLPHTSNRGTP